MPGLERLLRPRSIAVIGGGAWCANVMRQCRTIGFDGAVWPVHPSRAEIGSVPAFPVIESLPEAPDAAFIGVNRDLTIDAVSALARLGAGGAVCFASGFREAQAETGDGDEKQAALLDAAGAMTILGPNCYGFVNYLDGAALWPDQQGGARVGRGVAILTQSSNIALNLTMQSRGLPIAYLVTVGNQAQTGLSAIATALLQDDRVTALGLHVEGIGDLSAFEAMAHAARHLGKPIVVMKVGASDQARAGAVSHTASLAGSDVGADALFAHLGIGRAFSLAALLETLKLLHVSGPLVSTRIASMSCSGGEASLMADMAQRTTLVFPPLGEPQRTGLRAALGPRVALANPLDYHTYVWGDEDALTRTFSAMMEADLALGCVTLDFPRSDRCSTDAWEPVIGAVARTGRASGRPMAIMSSLPELMPEEVALRLLNLGITPFAGMAEAIEAMQVAASIGQSHAAPEPIIAPRTGSAGPTLSEAEAKGILAAHGVQVPRSERAHCPETAAAEAERIGFPVVLKAEGIAHKTDAGAVAPDLRSAVAVAAAARAMPGAGLLVEEMITGTIVELLVGVVSDPAHGYVLTLAAGGTLTELLDDRASLLLPCSRGDVRAALGSLRMAPVLTGYRGRPAADIVAIVDAVMALQAAVAAIRPFEIEINPLMCGPKGAVAVDALIRPGGTID